MIEIDQNHRTALQGLHRNTLVVITIAAIAATLGGCANERGLPFVYMPTPPKECEQVMDFKVEPLPKGKSNAAALSVAMAKEGATRQQEHTTSKVCAEYALRTAGVMKDKEAPRSPNEPAVVAATTTPRPKAATSTTATAAPVPSAPMVQSRTRTERTDKTEEVPALPQQGS